MSHHASLVETCSSSRYLQPASPVYLSPGFNQGCSFYSEYVEKEPGDYICTKVSHHASLAETCSSSRYLQPASPVYLSPGFNQGCSFYSEYVEKEPGDYICTTVSRHASLLETCSSSRYLQPAPPVYLSPGFNQGCSFNSEYVEKDPGEYICTTVSRHASLLETCSSSRYLQPASPVYLFPGFNQGCSFYSEYVEKEPGDYICTTVSLHASLVETCSSSRYLQPTSPVYLSPGFNQGCSFYSEYVEKESGEYICTTVSRHASLVETCSSSRYLQPVSPVYLSPIFNQGCSFYS